MSSKLLRVLQLSLWGECLKVLLQLNIYRFIKSCIFLSNHLLGVVAAAFLAMPVCLGTSCKTEEKKINHLLKAFSGRAGISGVVNSKSELKSTF